MQEYEGCPCRSVLPIIKAASYQRQAINFLLVSPFLASGPVAQLSLVQSMLSVPTFGACVALPLWDLQELRK